jgi:hypothetical protein
MLVLAFSKFNPPFSKLDISANLGRIEKLISALDAQGLGLVN